MSIQIISSKGKIVHTGSSQLGNGEVEMVFLAPVTMSYKTLTLAVILSLLGLRTQGFGAW